MRQPELKTDRLLLRAFSLADAADVHRLANNYAVSRTTLNMPYPYQPGTAEKWIGGQRRSWECRDSATFAVTLGESGALLGAVTLTWINRSTAELGYWIGEPYWRNGYCSEAVRAVIEFGFERLGLHKILAEHLRDNPASGKVMLNAGMRHIGSARKKNRDRAPAEMDIYHILKPAPAEAGGQPLNMAD